MERNLTLRIGGLAADLNADALILFNYTAEQMDSPAAVKNSYSKQVTLPGTPGNDAIFGRFWRADRVTAPGGVTGPAFNAFKRTPFAIMAEGEIIEAGYCKLDSLTRRGDLVTGYALTLYGGLGSFYYALSYAEGGDGIDGKRTLADLAYLDGAANELDFKINAAAVSAAWARLASGEYPENPSKWDVINFAPTYGGLPEGTFDAAKALFKPAAVGLPIDVDGKKPAGGGWSLVDLGADRTEWDVKDLRSYMQRPVLNVKKFIDACCNPANNGGWTVRLDPAFFNADNPYFAKAWMTLPRLDSLTLPVEHSEGALVFPAGPVVTVDPQAESVSAALGDVANSKVHIEIEAGLSATLEDFEPDIPIMTSLYLCSDYTAYTGDKQIRNGFFLQAVVRDGDNNALAVSRALCLQSVDKDGNIVNPDDFATAAGYTPVSVSGESVGIDAVTGKFYGNGRSAYWYGDALKLAFDASIVGDADLTVELILTPAHGGQDWAPIWCLYKDRTQNSFYEMETYPANVMDADYSADTLTEVHTGATVKKATLLSTAQSPAEVLFGYCKLFGLKFLTDRAANTVSILSRGTFYTGAVEDIDARIDRAQDVQTVPQAVAAKWYDFGLETAGAFADYYKKIRGRVYGTQRVNTGFEFDATVKDVLSGSPFKGAAEVLEQSKLFYNPTWMQGGVEYNMPAAFLAGGCKYTLYGPDGSEEFDTGSAAATAPAMNPTYKGYDVTPKAQLHDDSLKALDGAGVLLFYRGADALSRFSLSDDISAMAALNGGTPCWLLEQGAAALSVPSFGRYLWDGANIADSFDLGRPAEVDIPGVVYPAGTEIYARFWAAFMADRYHVDTRVVTAWADLRGLPVGEELMRRFFRFDGALWALSKIIDFDLTGTHLTKCEFVKVQAVENYE